MTREDAIKILKGKMDGHTDTSYEWVETVRMAIKALEQEPCGDVIIDKHYWKGFNNGIRTEKFRESKRQELCEDAVSKRAVLKSFFDDDTEYTGSEICSMIRNLPSVKPQEKTGHWIHFASSDDCSECGWSTGRYVSPSKYCPGCGCLMIEAQESEEV